MLYVVMPIVPQLVTVLSLATSCASRSTCTCLGSLGIVTLSRKNPTCGYAAAYSATISNSVVTARTMLVVVPVLALDPWA
jgi:hypothetical protein